MTLEVCIMSIGFLNREVSHNDFDNDIRLRAVIFTTLAALKEGMCNEKSWNTRGNQDSCKEKAQT